MSQSLRFSGYFDFYFTQQTQGGDITNYFIAIDASVKQMTTNVTKSTQSLQRQGTSMRRLALDVRLVSSSIRQMVTAAGLQDTAVGKLADGFTVLAGATVGIISGHNAYTKINKMLTAAIAKQGGVLKAVTAAAKAFGTVLMSTLGVALMVVLAAAVAFNAVWADTTGINQYRESIKSLETDIEGLENTIKSLSLTQKGLGVETAALSAQQATLDDAFKKGLITEEDYTKKTNMLDVSRAGLGKRTADLSYQEKFYQFEVAQGTASIEENKRLIDEQWKMRNKMLTGGGGDLNQFATGKKPTGGALDPWRALRRGLGSLLGFESGGTVGRTGPVYAHAGEQIIPAGESTGGAISLTISLAGAHIYGSEGMEEALEVGGNKLKKQLEFMRRPRARW